jgi:hypothetical protein
LFVSNPAHFIKEIRMDSRTLGTQHGAAARKRANRIVFVTKEQTWTGLDYLSTQVMTAGHYVLGFARGLIATPRSRPRRRG